MQENHVRSLGREKPLEKGMATHSSTLAGEFHGQRSRAGYSPWGRKESDTTESHNVTHTGKQKTSAADTGFWVLFGLKGTKAPSAEGTQILEDEPQTPTCPKRQGNIQKLMGPCQGAAEGSL